MSGDGDPIGAKVGLEGRGHEDGAILGTEQASGRCQCPRPPPPCLPEGDPSTPHLLLVALQEGDEEARDSTGRGVHLGESYAHVHVMTSTSPGEAEA